MNAIKDIYRHYYYHNYSLHNKTTKKRIWVYAYAPRILNSDKLIYQCFLIHKKPCIP